MAPLPAEIVSLLKTTKRRGLGLILGFRVSGLKLSMLRAHEASIPCRV